MSIKVYGHSDDCIEVEGDIREEIYSDRGEPMHIGFSDGTVLRVEYMDDGCWHIRRAKEGKAGYSHVQATGPDENYSDEVELQGEISWMVAGTLYLAAKKVSA